jgi:excisionase family DNA binding protein
MDDRNRSTTSTPTAPDSRSTNGSPWLTVEEAAQRARCGVKTIYREVHANQLRAARVGGRRELRLLPEWIDEWLLGTTTPRPV